MMQPDTPSQAPLNEINSAVQNEAGARFIARCRKTTLIAITALIAGIVTDAGTDYMNGLPVITGIITAALIGLRMYMNRSLNSAIAGNKRYAVEYPETFLEVFAYQKEEFLKKASEGADHALMETIFAEMAEEYIP